MELNFPLRDVKIEIGGEERKVLAPLLHDSYYCLNQDEFSMDVPGVAKFYACGGEYVSILPCSDADPASVSLYLNGSVYGAILHQRKILPLHGSCFSLNGSATMICGDSGAGKSSLTASFCLNGAEFLTDDVTPLLFNAGKPFIWALSDRIKLWGDTLKQLEQEEAGLFRIFPETEKFYYPMAGTSGDTFSLDQIYIIEPGDHQEVIFDEVSGSSKFSALRNEIYRLEYLKGMPGNEADYFENLIDLCNHVNVTRVKRPAKFRITELRELVEKHLVYLR